MNAITLITPFQDTKIFANVARPYVAPLVGFKRPENTFPDALEIFNASATPKSLIGLNDDPQLTKAKHLLAQRIQLQTRRNGSFTIHHPLHILQRLEQKIPNLTSDQRVAAVLHDIIEDTDLTLEDLHRYGFTPQSIKIVASMTRYKEHGELYLDFIRRLSHNKDAIPVKIADILDNMKDLPDGSMYKHRYQICIEYLNAVYNEDIPPGAPIEMVLNTEQTHRHQDILNDNQSSYYEDNIKYFLPPKIDNMFSPTALVA